MSLNAKVNGQIGPVPARQICCSEVDPKEQVG